MLDCDPRRQNRRDASSHRWIEPAALTRKAEARVAVGSAGLAVESFSHPVLSFHLVPRRLSLLWV